MPLRNILNLDLSAKSSLGLYISSSAIKELMTFHAEYSQYVPEEILGFLKEKEKNM